MACGLQISLWKAEAFKITPVASMVSLMKLEFISSRFVPTASEYLREAWGPIVQKLLSTGPLFSVF